MFGLVVLTPLLVKGNVGLSFIDHVCSLISISAKRCLTSMYQSPLFSYPPEHLFNEPESVSLAIFPITILHVCSV